MYEIKVNLIMSLPGRTMMSEQECLRKVRKPLMGKGKKANKQVIDKNGNPVWHTVLEANPAKTDRFQINFVDKNGKPDGYIVVHTRKSRPAKRHLNICQEAYKNFISNSVPEAFHVPKGFKAPEVITPKGKKRPKYIGIALREQAWLEMSETERLEWHLKGLCTALDGVLDSYEVLDD